MSDVERPRICLLTGAGGLLGDAFCRRMAAHYSIAAVYRSEPPAVPSQHRALFDPVHPRRSLAGDGAQVFAIKSDLLMPGEVERVAEIAVARFGQIDVLINNAADLSAAPVTDSRLRDAWEEQLILNSVVPVHLAATLATACWSRDELENRDQRRNIINVSSTSGLGDAPGIGRGFYGASKAALNVLSRQMAVEYRVLGIRVNAVAPTTFPQRIQISRVLDAFQCIDSGDMSGQVLVVDDEDRWI